MEKERRIKVLSLVALVVAVLGLTVAFAALSQTLTINGTASVDAAQWDVHFESLSEPTITGGATLITPPTINDDSTYIGDFEISITKPGDGVSFVAEIVNAGTISAENGEALINGINEYNDDFDKILESIYIEADWDGDGITTLDERQKAYENIEPDLSYSLTSAGTDNDLIPGERGTFTFGVKFKADAEEIPKGKIKMRLNIDLNFVQK